MRALGIIGSPRKDGNTAYLLTKTFEVLENGEVEKEAIKSSERLGNGLLDLIKKYRKMEEKRYGEPYII